MEHFPTSSDLGEENNFIIETFLYQKNKLNWNENILTKKNNNYSPQTLLSNFLKLSLQPDDVSF